MITKNYSDPGIKLFGFILGPVTAPPPPPLSQRDGSSGSLAANKRYKSVMGTDGDLRKLKLSKARSVLRNFGVPDEEVSRAPRVYKLLCALTTPHKSHFPTPAPLLPPSSDQQTREVAGD